MTASLSAKANGTQGALLVNGSEVVVFDSTGITSGVNKAAVSQMPTLSTAVNTTSGTSISFTGIPSWVKRITLSLVGVSTTGTSPVMVQIGSGSTLATGYLGCVHSFVGGVGSTSANNTSGAILDTGGASAAASIRHGQVVISLVTGTSTWTINGNIGLSNAITASTCGFSNNTLGGALDRVILTTVGGTDTFDAGILNILYE